MKLLETASSYTITFLFISIGLFIAALFISSARYTALGQIDRVAKIEAEENAMLQLIGHEDNEAGAMAVATRVYTIYDHMVTLLKKCNASVEPKAFVDASSSKLFHAMRVMAVRITLFSIMLPTIGLVLLGVFGVAWAKYRTKQMLMLQSASPTVFITTWNGIVLFVWALAVYVGLYGVYVPPVVAFLVITIVSSIAMYLIVINLPRRMFAWLGT